MASRAAFHSDEVCSPAGFPSRDMSIIKGVNVRDADLGSSPCPPYCGVVWNIGLFPRVRVLEVFAKINRICSGIKTAARGAQLIRPPSLYNGAALIALRGTGCGDIAVIVKPKREGLNRHIIRIEVLKSRNRAGEREEGINSQTGKDSEESHFGNC